MIKILLADDHKIVREGLKQIISEQSDMEVTGEASTGQEALDLMCRNDYDLILLDISMPGKNGIDILNEIKSDNHHTNILVLSMHSEEQYAVRVIKSGGSGYMTKDTAPEELINAIRKIYHGGKYISLTIAEKLAFDFDNSASKLPHERLSNREFQIMCLISSGKTVTEIAHELSISVKTVSTHRMRILNKTDLRTNAEMTYYSVKQGLLE